LLESGDAHNARAQLEVLFLYMHSGVRTSANHQHQATKRYGQVIVRTLGQLDGAVFEERLLFSLWLNRYCFAINRIRPNPTIDTSTIVANQKTLLLDSFDEM